MSKRHATSGRLQRDRRGAVTRLAALCAGAWAALRAPAALGADPSPARWDTLRQQLFAGRTFEPDATGVVELDLPVRADDAAVVPLIVRTHAAPPDERPQRYVRKIYLVIDNNPSPLGAIFTFTPDSGRADIETRVRIEDYTDVHAIAETSDGKLYVATRYVKAAGGCSAPAGKDAALALAQLGKLRLRTDGAVRVDQPSLAQLMISHPNDSGLVMDQVTRLYTPPRFVRTLAVTYAGKPVLSAELDFTISENPNFRFYFVPRGAGELKAEVIDTDGRAFEGAIDVRPGS